MSHPLPWRLLAGLLVFIGIALIVWGGGWAKALGIVVSLLASSSLFFLFDWTGGWKGPKDEQDGH